MNNGRMNLARRPLKTSPTKVANRLRVERAIQLRIAGHSYEDIAREAGYSSLQAAQRAVSRYLEKSAEGSDELRERLMRRMDDIALTLAPLVQQGDLAAIDRVVKVSELQAKIGGLTKQQPTSTVNAVVIHQDKGRSMLDAVETWQRLVADTVERHIRDTVAIVPGVIVEYEQPSLIEGEAEDE